ncbi:multidrug ABC transporter ATP-binding protein [Polaribacter vadi]|uniref:Multidrug ABC transporter ATP-binding protein n=1 Tax=Polaribacter vadi TaxID=1774273 RepID=A0A1B8TTW3_9FLAO|nr:ATP-binding cassette domain-containing protein [Polaribacter vadi]AOW18146.1 multidrug ABC transporter ATP-binding protein [Polaribacter vadi]OBY62875.1 multidrug ABC transporter ATP-binding protein [Polaribacter vadi]
MTTNIVEIQDLSHQYSKDWAVKEVSFNIKSKGILGLLGSNGAGKSTTMNILCGVINQTQGTVLINGIDMQKNPVEAKKLIGFLPQKAPLYLDLTVDEYLTHCAHIRLMPEKSIKQALEEVKERCGIAHFSKRLLKNLSGGYQQRVGIAQAIIHKPLLVVLDEPTNGLDPVQILEVRKLIKEIGKEHAVIFSTHILSEVQAACDDIKMIEKGRMVFEGTVAEFGNYQRPDSLLMTMELPPNKETLKAISGVLEVEAIDGKTVKIQFDTNQDITENLISESVKNGWRLTGIHLEKSSLDDVFAQLSQKDAHAN